MRWRRFLYLNEEALNGYLSAAEGGLSNEVRRKKQSGKDRKLGGGGALAGFRAEAGMGSTRGQEEELTTTDTPEQRFDRLIALLEDDEDFVDAIDLSESYGFLTTGTMLSVECDLDIPSAVRLFGFPQEFAQMRQMAAALRTFGPVIDEDTDDLPTDDQLAAADDLVQSIGPTLVVVGRQTDDPDDDAEDAEDAEDEDAVHVAGKLDRQWLRADDPTGTAIVVGKVEKRWGKGKSQALLALPGASLLSGKERRAYAQDALDEDQVLRGPAVTLDILAIYR